MNADKSSSEDATKAAILVFVERVTGG